MKKTLFCLAFSLMMPCMVRAQVEENTDNALFRSAIEFFDKGETAQALEIFNGLIKRNPENHNVMYEIALCHYGLKEYDKAIAILKKLKKADPNPRVFTLYGNCLDDKGKLKDALAMYDDGIKLFPDNGHLHLEKGVIYMKSKNYDDAYACFKAGINAQPSFASNYFRVAQLVIESRKPYFGIVCAEVHSLLSPASERSNVLSEWMYDAYQSNVKYQGDSVAVLLENTFNINPLAVFADITNTVNEMAFVSCYINAAKGCYEPLKTNGKLSIKDVVEFRKRILDGYNNPMEHSVDSVPEGYDGEDADSILIYGDAEDADSVVAVGDELSEKDKKEMDAISKRPVNTIFGKLMKYQTEILEAGHWEAYNMWLFRNGNVEEFKAWLADNDEKFKSFSAWYDKHKFTFDAE